MKHVPLVKFVRLKKFNFRFYGEREGIRVKIQRLYRILIYRIFLRKRR